MKQVPFAQTSVFVDPRYRFGGNQLATFWDASANSTLNEEEMLGIAREMNFSETTFLESPRNASCSARVRIFTPAKEIPFAGHPTLGTAFVMKHKNMLDLLDTQTLLELGVGPVQVSFDGPQNVSMIQPEAVFKKRLQSPDWLAEALSIDLSDFCEEPDAQIVSTGLPFVLVPLKSLEAVRACRPSSERILSALAREESQEVLVFSPETEHEDSHVHARMFAPGVGVLEDPATGSAAGPLGAYIEEYSILSGHSKGSAIMIEQGFEINRPSRLVYRHSTEGPVVSGEVRLTAEGRFFI